MSIDQLDASIKEAERFLEKARAAKKRIQEDKYAIYGCRETGAVKRASLDLSHALSALRRRGG